MFCSYVQAFVLQVRMVWRFQPSMLANLWYPPKRYSWAVYTLMAKKSVLPNHGLPESFKQTKQTAGQYLDKIMVWINWGQQNPNCPQKSFNTKHLQEKWWIGGQSGRFSPTNPRCRYSKIPRTVFWGGLNTGWTNKKRAEQSILLKQSPTETPNPGSGI